MMMIIADGFRYIINIIVPGLPQTRKDVSQEATRAGPTAIRTRRPFDNGATATAAGSASAAERTAAARQEPERFTKVPEGIQRQADEASQRDAVRIQVAE